MSDEKKIYSQSEAEEILTRAARGSALDGGMTREQMLASAEELGISPEAVMEAEKSLKEERELDGDRQLYARYIKKKRYSELASWFGTSIMLAGINLFLLGFQVHSVWQLWCMYPIFFWGISIVGKLVEGIVSDKLHSEEKFQKWRQKGKPLEDETEKEDRHDWSGHSRHYRRAYRDSYRDIAGQIDRDAIRKNIETAARNGEDAERNQQNRN